MENLELNEEQKIAEIMTVKVKNYLMETSRWGKFLAILGYVGLGLMMIFSLMMLFGMSFLERSFGGMSQMYNSGALSLATMGFLYLIIAAIYFFPIYALHTFSTRIKTGLLTNSIEDVEVAFKNLKSLFKFMGIVSIIVLSIYVLALLIAIPVALYFS